MRFILMPYYYYLDPIIEAFNKLDNHQIVGVVVTREMNSCLINNNFFCKNKVAVINNLEDCDIQYDALLFFKEYLSVNKAFYIEQFNYAKLNTKPIFPVKPNDDLSFINYSISVPTVSFCRATQNIPLITVLTDIMQFFQRSSIKCTVISDNILSSFFGFKNYPCELSHDLSSSKKIQILNRYISELCNEQKSQILLLDIPNSIEDEKFWIIQRAINSDFNILFFEAHKYDVKYYPELQKLFQERFLGHIDEYVMSNYTCNYMGTDDNNEAIFFEEETMKQLTESKVITQYQTDIMYRHILDKLMLNGAII